MAAAIYIDKNGDSHIVDDPGAANTGVPPEALEALKKYKLCGTKYGSAALTNDKLTAAINQDYAAAEAARKAREPGLGARKTINDDAEKTLAAALKKIEEDCKKAIAAADEEMNRNIAIVNAGGTPNNDYAGMTKAQGDAKAHRDRDKQVNGKGGIAERCQKKRKEAKTDSEDKVKADIKKLPPLPPPPPPPPLSCAENAECKECEKGYITTSPAYQPPAKKSDDPPAEPMYRGHTGSIDSLNKDHMYFCTCGLK